MVKIGDIDKDTFRLQNINLVQGPVNAIEYSTVMLKMTPLTKLAA